MELGEPTYLASHLNKITTQMSQVQINLVNCDNCVVCASTKTQQPRVVAFKPSLSDNPDCEAIVGNIRSETEKKTYNRTALINVPRNESDDS